MRRLWAAGHCLDLWFIAQLWHNTNAGNVLTTVLPLQLTKGASFSLPSPVRWSSTPSLSSICRPHMSQRALAIATPFIRTLTAYFKDINIIRIARSILNVTSIPWNYRRSLNSLNYIMFYYNRQQLIKQPLYRGCSESNIQLTLRELLSFASAFKTVLLAFHHAWVTLELSSLSQLRLEVVVDWSQRLWDC